MGKKKKFHPPNQLRNFRLDENYTLSDVAFILEMKNVGRISEWENGQADPDIDHILDLGLLYHRLESQIYYNRRTIRSKRIEARKKLLQEIKEREQIKDEGG